MIDKFPVPNLFIKKMATIIHWIIVNFALSLLLLYVLVLVVVILTPYASINVIRTVDDDDDDNDDDEYDIKRNCSIDTDEKSF